MKKFFSIATLVFFLMPFSHVFSHVEHYKNLKLLKYGLYFNDKLIGHHTFEFNKKGGEIINRPIGFSGVIDGNGKTIRNLTNVQNSRLGNRNKSLFPIIYGAEIRNLNVSDCRISGSEHVSMFTNDSVNASFRKLKLTNIHIIGEQGARHALVCSQCANILIENTQVIDGTLEYTGNASTGNVGLVGGVIYNSRIYRTSAQGTIQGFNKFTGGLFGGFYTY